MATQYADIYDKFTSSITDYSLLAMADADIEKNLLKFLRGAISDFKYCVQDLSDRDDTTSQFYVDLTDQEQDILAKFMVVRWLDPIISNLDNLKQKFGNKDFQIFSSSNHLKELREFRELRKSEAESDMSFYYYSN